VPGCPKITNDSLTRSDAGCFIAVRLYGNSGHQRVKCQTTDYIVLIVIIVVIG